jgi:Site-specific recombinase XerD
MTHDSTPPQPRRDDSLTPFSGGRPIQRGYTMHVPVAPLQFPSIEHLDARVEAAIKHAVDVRGLRPTTCVWARRSYASFRRFLREAAAERRFISGQMAEQTALLEAWISWMRERALSRVAINSYWRGVGAVLRWITRPDGLANPMLFVETPRVGRLLPHFLTKESAEKVVAFVQNHQWSTSLERARNEVIIGLLLLSGLRRGEVVRLAYGDVDVEHGTIRIRAGKGTFGGKDRTAYMPPQLRGMVAAYQDARGRQKRTHPEFLTHLYLDRGIGGGTISRLCVSISRQTGIHVRPHALRHTYATLLRRAGVADRVSMELLGHTTLSMLTRYSHVYDDEPGAAANTLVLDV